MISLLNEKTLKQSIVDKKIVDKEAKELKKNYNQISGKRTDIMNITQLKVEDVFDDLLGKDNFSPEQITERKLFSQIDVNENLVQV